MQQKTAKTTPKQETMQNISTANAMQKKQPKAYVYCFVFVRMFFILFYKMCKTNVQTKCQKIGII